MVGLPPEQTPLRAEATVDDSTPAAPPTRAARGLRLSVEPADLPDLRRHRLLRELTVGRAHTRSLHSVTFDTPELALLRQGVSLRVRRAGRRFVQTVQWGEQEGAGWLDRQEFECTLPSATPAPERLAHPELVAKLREWCGGSALEPVLETETRRTQRRLRVSDTEISCALDVGEIRTPRGSVPLCELELELVQGEPHRLYEVAKGLQKSVRLRIQSRGKYLRGVEKLTGAHPSPVKMQRVRLSPGTTLEEALAATLRASFAQILANEECARRGVDPEGVHQMRVGVRRMRSTLALFRRVLPDSQTDGLKRELRWLASELGRARDLDVFFEEGLAPLVRRFPDDPDLKRLRDEAAELRAERQRDVTRSLGSLRYAELMLSLGHWISAREWRDQVLPPASALLFQPARPQASELLARRYRKVRRRGRAIDRAGDAEKHALRIEVKKLRYACEFLRGLYRGRHAGRFVRRTAQLQDRLGHLTDASMARGILAELIGRMGADASGAAIRAAGFVEGWIARAASTQTAGIAKGLRALERRGAFWEDAD